MADEEGQTTEQGDTKTGESAEAGKTTDGETTTTTVAGETKTPKGLDLGTETAAPAGPPDAYDLTVPAADGFDSFTETDLVALKGVARAQKLTNEQAQTFLDALPVHYADQRQRFRTDLEAHPTLGGDKLEGVELRVKRVLDHYLPADTPEGQRLRQGMDLTGYGNWPPLVALLDKVGLSIAEDRPGVVKPTEKGSGEGIDSKDWFDHPTSQAAAQ